jgi:4-hydroxybenzoate polyprenyltransferase
MRAYLELLRPANVATALADIIAGAAIAASGRSPGVLAWLLAASACLYAGGVVLNDFFDRRIDAVERPERPIPSGRVAPAHAAVLGGVLLALGVLLASLAGREPALVAVVIALLVLGYDAGVKHLRILGPLNMGACRGANLLLGMAAVPAGLAAHWHVALISVIYIGSVTVLSRGEVHGGRHDVGLGAFAMMVLVVIVLSTKVLAAGANIILSGGLTAVLAWRVLPPFWQASKDDRPATIRTAVKAGVLNLVILDAALAAVYAEPVYAVATVATGVLAMALARLFAVT